MNKTESRTKRLADLVAGNVIRVTINRTEIRATTLAGLQRAFNAHVDASGFGYSETVGASRKTGGWTIRGRAAIREGAEYLSYNGRAWRGTRGTNDHAEVVAAIGGAS
jgi:hypothetical protein